MNAISVIKSVKFHNRLQNRVFTITLWVVSDSSTALYQADGRLSGIA